MNQGGGLGMNYIEIVLHLHALAEIQARHDRIMKDLSEMIKESRELVFKTQVNIADRNKGRVH